MNGDIFISESRNNANLANTKRRLYSMRKYENLVIVKPTFTAEEIQASIKAIEEIITSNGGEIATTDSMGMRKLAYPIDKNERGYYHVIYYTVAPAAITEIERRFRINEDMLRFVTIKYDTNREITAWNQLVQKAEKKAAPAPVKEETPEAPAVEEAPTATEETPVAQEAAAE
jgi:small subunit ribosomal protein S6